MHIPSCLWVKVSPVHPQLLLSTRNRASVQWIVVNWEPAEGRGESATPENNKSKVASPVAKSASVWIPILCSWPGVPGLLWGGGLGSSLYSVQPQRPSQEGDSQWVLGCDARLRLGQMKDGRNAGCLSPFGPCRPWGNAWRTAQILKEQLNVPTAILAKMVRRTFILSWSLGNLDLLQSSEVMGSGWTNVNSRPRNTLKSSTWLALAPALRCGLWWEQWPTQCGSKLPRLKTGEAAGRGGKGWVRGAWERRRCGWGKELGRLRQRQEEEERQGK